MIELRTWYTYATNVFGYSDPKYKLILGITRPSTCKRLLEVDKFLICPKNTTRHIKENFKESYQSLYNKKNLIVFDDKHIIQLCAEIKFHFYFEPKTQNDVDLLRALNPYSLWTLQHIIEYTSGKKVYQEGMKFGNIAVFAIRAYYLSEQIELLRESKPRVANQFFNIEAPSYILEDIKPVIPKDEFDEILLSIKNVYDYYKLLWYD